MMLEQARSQLLIVDMQERLVPAMARPEQVEARCLLLAEAAQRLGVPVLFSQQYPKGLGSTLPSLLAAVREPVMHDKLSFSCAREPALRDLIDVRRAAGRDQLVIAGVEAHVCVLQTVLDLIGPDLSVFIAADAVSSRIDEDRDRALARAAAHGAEVVTTEMVVFEWLERAGTDEFRAVSKLVKQRP